MLKKLKQRNDQGNKKVTLPAALFNRSPMKASKISQNSSVMGNMSILSDRSNVGDGPTCSTHPTKSGRYYRICEQDGQITNFCQKCAILLASQGFKVHKNEKISVNSKIIESVKPSRKQQLQQFINLTDNKIKHMTNILNITLSQYQNLQKNNQQNIQRIQLFFTTLLITINKYKNNCLQIAKQSKKHLQQNSKNNIQYLKQKIQILQYMKDDILSSFQSIVNQTPQKDYNLVMNHYKKAFQEIQIKQKLDDLNQPILPDLQSFQKILSSQLGHTHTRNAHFSFDTSKNTF